MVFQSLRGEKIFLAEVVSRKFKRWGFEQGRVELPEF